MRHLFLLLIGFSVLPVSPLPAADHIQFYHLGKDAELAQSTINGLYQDEYGALWIGTRNGVKKYDGMRIELMKIPGLSGGVSSAYHPSVCGDRNGHVFFNTDYRVVEYDLRQDSHRTIFAQRDVSRPPAISFCYGAENLWIGLKDSLFSYSGGRLALHMVLSEPSAEISSICESSTGTLYVATTGQGLFCIDRQKRESRHDVSDSEIITLFEDSRRHLWLGTLKDGLYRLLPDGGMEHYTQHDGRSGRLLSNYIRSVAEDNAGHIWIGTMLGVNRLNPSTGEMASYGLAEKGQSGLSNLSVWVILKDRMGTMWFGTYYGGVNYCNPETNLFTYIDIGMPAGNGYPLVSRMAEDLRGDLWIATEGNGLVHYDPRSGRSRFFTQGSGSVPHNNIKSLHYDRRSDRLWIGTHLGGLTCYDIPRQRFRHFTIDPDDHSKNSEIIHGLAATDDYLYIGTLSNVYRLTLSTGNIDKIEALEHHFFEIKDLILDDSGRLWIAGNQLCRYDPATDGVRFFNTRLRAATASDQIFTTCLFKSSRGEILIGTSGEGVIRYLPAEERFEVYNSRTLPLLNDYITCLGEMTNGLIVAGSGSGFSCLDLQQFKSYRFNAANGFPLLSMLPGCVIRNHAGNMILGGLNGITVLDDRAMLAGTLPIRLFFSKLWINNREVAPRDNTGILSGAFWAQDEIRLEYNQNNLSIGIGNDNFLGAGQPLYQYKLAGFDREWVDFSLQDQIRYMNLPYGRYRLLVRSTVYQNSENIQEIGLNIIIRPPFYLRWYAFLFYLLLLGGLVCYIRFRLLLRTSLELERREKQQQEEINDTKQRFFANMSHELRTPLTLITGQLELLLMTDRIPAHIHKSLKEAYSSASRMNRLISELLDFLKYTRGKYRLRIGKFGIIGFVHDIYLSFSALAELKKIEFSFRAAGEEQEVWFDPLQMQKVFNNLLSNAFKYTPSGGRISLEMERGEGEVRILIRDSGIGIPGSMKEKIFERFVQGANPAKRDWSQTGTGIGLSLTRNIVEAHHGSIRVESQAGEGSVFIVSLLCGESVFEADECIEFLPPEEPEEAAFQHVLQEDRAFLEELYDEQGKNNPVLSRLLIVEDDERLRKMLVEIFEPIFQVYEADNGESGLEMARAEAPDLVLSDVMMPGMPGGELCRQIKHDFDTCHIPVVLLTALGGVDHRIEGFHCGADDYVSKPFSIKLLVTRCLSLLNNRRLLQQKFSAGEETSVQIVTTNAMDRKFLDDAVKIVEENVEHGGIDVGLLASKLAVSRTKLFLKMKGITGQSPHEFIQNIKLRVAARLLREQPDMNISDIAFYLGFSSLNYFGKYFRNFFGMSPSVYRKSQATDRTTSEPLPGD